MGSAGLYMECLFLILLYMGRKELSVLRTRRQWDHQGTLTLACFGDLHGRMNYEDTKPYYVGFSFSWPVNRICGIIFNRFIDWRYIHSWFVFSIQLVNCCPHGRRNYTCVLLPLYCTLSLTSLKFLRPWCSHCLYLSLLLYWFLLCAGVSFSTPCLTKKTSGGPSGLDWVGKGGGVGRGIWGVRYRSSLSA